MELIRTNIQENIHLFITYAGTISTIDLDRTTFFRKISTKHQYGHISKTAEKILYLAKSWNLGFAKTCRKIARVTPSQIYSDFLDRLAATMDFGGDLETFLSEEQDAVLNDYETEYKGSLNNIGMLREVFIAITISVAFGMSVALLLPLLEGISILVAVRWSLLGMLFIDVLLVILIKAFVPSDRLCHNLPKKDDLTRKIYKWFYIITPIVLVIAGVLFLFFNLSFIIVAAIAVTPYLYVGHLASKEEKEVIRKDKVFPSFVRALGTTIYARQGGITSSLAALRVHDFGPLDSVVTNLYRRLKLGSDREKSWYYFAVESGSNMINYFAHIFAESVYLGGHAQKIGELISKNFSRLVNLRSLRHQQAASLRGALYGSLLGFIATIYISVSITNMLATIFVDSFVESATEGAIGGLIGSVVPTIPEVDMTLVNLYIGIMVFIHAFVSSLIIKMVDGGQKFAFFFDFTMMLWLGAILSYFVPLVSSSLFSPVT